VDLAINMRVFPESALVQLEFDKIQLLLTEHCKTEYAKLRAENLRIHTRKELIELELQQSNEYKLLIQGSQYFPNDHVLNLSKEIKLLGIAGAVLTGDQMMQVRKLAESLHGIFRWFDTERRNAYPALAKVIGNTYYEKTILQNIDEVLDENGTVKDNASDSLSRIRLNLYKRRNELRRLFDRIVQKLT
jgi:DNA mismatch repair protein MutS2